MDVTLPASWGVDRRGFWTKRKKTATSMLSVLALLAGIALAFKLFSQTVPNNVVRDASNFNFAVEVFRAPPSGGAAQWLPAGGGPGQVPIFASGVDIFPGDTRTEQVRIRNTNTTPARDATFFVYVDPASITVARCVNDINGNCTTVDPFQYPDAIIPPNDPRWAKFVNLFSFSVDKENVLTVSPAPNGDINENDHGLTNPPPDLHNHDASKVNRTSTACSGGLREINKNAPCNLGTARAAGSAELGQNGTLQPTDTRWYQFHITEVDDGTDQSAFEGWQIKFTLVFQARIPALPGSTAPVSER
jgi:hypothetical protein